MLKVKDRQIAFRVSAIMDREVDRLLHLGGYLNRSEMIRSLVREKLAYLEGKEDHGE